MPRLLALAVALAVALAAAGCSADPLDVNRRTLVYAVAVDYEHGARQYAVAVAYTSLGASSSSGPSGGGSLPTVTVDTTQGRTVDEALIQLEDELPAQAYFGSTRLLLLGPSVLRHGADDAILAVARQFEMPLRLYVAATRQSAGAFLASPAARSQRPLYSLFQSRDPHNIAIRPGLLFSLVGQAASPRLDTLLPEFDFAGSHLRFEGDVVVAAGRERAHLAPADVPLVAPLAASGETAYRLDLSGRHARPVVLMARRASAAVVTRPDGSVLVHLQVRGYVAGHEMLADAGYTEAALEQALQTAMAQRELAVLVRLRRAGVDPRGLADRDWPPGRPLRLEVEASVRIDRSQVGP